MKHGFLLYFSIIFIACAPEPETSEMPASRTAPISVEKGPSSELQAMDDFKVTSESFNQGDKIPSTFTCDGEDVSPPLEWSNSPEETVTFALILDDPDAPAGTWVHWILFNLPPDVQSLDRGLSPGGNLPSGAVQGQNSWGRKAYGGPCPPGGEHRYFFKLYALDQELNLGSQPTADQLLQAMEGHILARAELMGVYQRSN